MSTVLITSVAGGTCVTRHGNVVNNQTRSSTPAQRWSLEPGPKKQSFAFRNAETGNYLHANNGAASAAIGPGAKQFWLLEPGVAPGSCYLKCEDYPNAYLASKSGSPHNGNVVYVWPKQAVWTHALTWYLHDAKSEGFMPKAETTKESKDGNDAAQAKEAELIKREGLVAAREAALEKSEAAAAAKLVELQAKEVELQAQEKSLTSEQWQRWPKKQSFAFRNAETGNYLHANNGAASAAIGPGAKQFWLLEPGVAPGSCYLKCEDYPNAYLASKSGSPHNGNVVYVWPKQAVWTHALTWYLHDAKSEGFMPKAETTKESKDGNDAAQAKEAELIKREGLVAAREAALEKSEAAAAAKLVELQAKEVELQAQEKSLTSERGKSQEAVGRARGDNLDNSAKASELADREAALQAKEAELSRRENALSESGVQQSSAALPSGTNTNSAPTNAADLQTENARLKAELAQLRDSHPFKLSKRGEKGALRTPSSPNFKLKSTFDPVLLKKFEEGRKLVKSNMKPVTSSRERE
nr:hypothetical protein CFP56_37040 [Quercus suber]